MSEENNKIRILVTDDELIVKQCLAKSLRSEDDFDIVGAAGSGPEAVQMVKALKPDILLLDLVLQGKEDGFSVCEAITSDPDVETKVVFLTSYKDASNYNRALKAGAAAFIGKNDGTDRLLDTIRTIHAVGPIINAQPIVENVFELSSRAVSAPNNAAAPRDKVAASCLRSLSPRELEILQMVARGDQNKFIASELKISEHTVRNHISNIFQKLQVSNRTQAGFAVKDLI